MKQEEFLEKLEVELKRSKNSIYTLKNYISFNSQFLNHIKKDPEKITENDIDFYMTENLSNRATTSLIMFLSALRYAYLRILKKDPTANIKRPKKEKKLQTVLSREDVGNLLKSLTNKKSELMISLIYFTGMKVSEITGLKINDLDFINNIGYIRRNEKKDIKFRIPNFLSLEMESYAKIQKDKGSTYVFGGMGLTQMSSRNIQKIVNNAAKKAGIKKSVRPHTLRHSFIEHDFENKNNIKNKENLTGQITTRFI